MQGGTCHFTFWQTMQHKRSDACLTCSVAGCGYSCCQGQWGKEGQASHLWEFPLFIKATPKYFKSDIFFCGRWFWGKGERRSWGGWEKIGGAGGQEPFLPTVLTLLLCSCVSFIGPAYTLSSTIYSTVYLDLGRGLDEVWSMYTLSPFPQFYLRQQ